MSSLHKQLSGSSQSHPSSQGKEEYWSRGAPGPGDLKQTKWGSVEACDTVIEFDSSVIIGALCKLN